MVNKTVIVVEFGKEIFFTKELNATLDTIFRPLQIRSLTGSCLNLEDSQQYEKFRPKTVRSSIQFDKEIKMVIYDLASE